MIIIDNMKHIRFIFSLLFLLWTAVATSQNLNSHYYFRNLGLTEGLSHSTVNVIMQDKIGFLWFGTKDGLNRFDGVNFRIFKKENSKLGNNFITTL